MIYSYTFNIHYIVSNLIGSGSAIGTPKAGEGIVSLQREIHLVSLNYKLADIHTMQLYVYQM